MTSPPIFVTHSMDLSWRYAPGAAMERFCAGLRERRIEALRCAGCGRRYLPPRPACGNCRCRLDEWVPVRDVGTLEAWTVVHIPILDARTGEPRPVPYGMGLVRLDGADTTLNHCLAESDPGKLRVGLRVRAVWRDDRRGDMGDIRAFALSDPLLEPERPEGGAAAKGGEATAAAAGFAREEAVHLPFRYAAGGAASRFLAALRDEGRLLGSRCTACGYVACPARAFCARCGEAARETTDVGPGGSVVSWTDVPGRATFVLVRPDGADGALVHRYLGDPSRLATGSRVRARLAEVRTASVLDLDGFEPEEGGSA